MPIVLRDLKRQARAMVEAGQLAAALRAHDHMLAANPLDSDSRRKIGDLLLALGDRDGAFEVIRAVAGHDWRSGRLLPAIVGAKILQAHSQPTDDLVRAMAAGYGHGSPALGKFAARQAPVDPDAPIAPVAAGDVDDPAAGARRARARALDLSVFVQYPEQFLPVAFFSDLPPQVFGTAIRHARLVRAGDGDVVIREGEPGTSFYLLASGEARVVTKAGPAAGGRARPIELTQLRDGALFGEMALVTELPRAASVAVVGEADLLEIDRAAVAALIAEAPPVAERLDRFTRERLLKNLFATSPLFKPFDAAQQMELLRRFEGHEVTAGTVIIREGEIGQGLFVILVGQVEVVRRDELGDDVLAKLGPSDVFGEMSLLDGSHTTNATVRAATPATVLFLGRQYFQRLTAALPELRRYFEELSRRRAQA